MVDESHAGNELYSSGTQNWNDASWIVTGRGLFAVCGVIGHEFIPSAIE